MRVYEKDFYGWTQEQATLLREHQFAQLDLNNLIEEIESMGRSERREVSSRMEQLLMHLLKWEYQPGFRGHSWRASIRNQRRELSRVLRDNPSLRSELSTTFREAYLTAVGMAEDETGLARKTFPTEPPFTLEQTLNMDWMPE